MADVTSLCQRIIIIHHGQLKYDGSLGDAVAAHRTVQADRRLALGEVRECDLSRYGDLVKTENTDGKQYVQVQAAQVHRNHGTHSGRICRCMT